MSDNPTEGADWCAWVDAYGARLMLYARQQTRTETDAEDVMQDALLQLVRAVESGRYVGEPRGWLPYVLAAIRHRAMDLGRRRQTRLKYEQLNHEAQVESTVNPWLHNAHDDDVYRLHVERILQRMSREYAEVLMLKIWEGLTFTQIAEVTGENVSTINSRYRRALERFRMALANDPLPD